MVQVNKNIITLLASFFIMFSCSDETPIGPERIEVEEGIPVTATLSFNSSNTVKVETRASDIANENPVNSLAILIFKKTGKSKIGDTKFCTLDEIKSGNIQVSTTSGNRYVYAVANYKSSLFDLESELTNIQSLDALKNLSVRLPENNISVLDGQFLMSGAFVGREDDEEGLCIIGTDGLVKNLDSDNSTSGKIDLKRIMASVKFNVSCGNTEATFVADSWQVKNIPQRSNLIEQKSGDYAGGEGDYLASKLNSAFNIEGNTYSFSFLMMENRKQPKSTSVFEYDEREKMSDSPEMFSVANDYSTYVVLKGIYTGKTSEEVNNDSDIKNVKAFTTYYVHLGDWRSKNYTNFDIFRNNRYTYNVSVQSIDRLIVEVVKNDEVWGGDGEIYLSTTSVRTFDAHYGTTVISFDKTMIRDLIYGTGSEPCSKDAFIESFKILASTPENNFSSNNTDINWVQYKRNTAGYNGFMKYKESQSDKPLDADGFREDLYDACIKDEDFGTDDSIRYTCFIDEYYYAGKPLREFINQQPRTIQIWTYYKKNDEESSNSSVSMTAYTFSQKSISTIYDLEELDRNNEINGWGMEWMQEGENLSPNTGHIPGKSSFYQGWQNTWELFASNLQWETYIDQRKNVLNTDYRHAEFACLTKNRDLNGNGKIDEDELRWYLPAITQYMELVVGENALSQEVRLNNDKITSSDLYISSSAYRDSYYVLAVSEGLSLSYKKNGTYPYRCIRNLRNITGDATTFVTNSGDYYGDQAYKNYSFNLLNPKAKRDNVSSALTPGHNVFDEENRLAESFDVGELIEDKNLTASEVALVNPCNDAKNGWRLPNQREVFIISFYRQQEGMGGSSLFSCTKSASGDSYCGFEDLREYTIPTMTVWPGTTRDKAYRCVRDKK